jgi:hypothetical protein
VHRKDLAVRREVERHHGDFDDLVGRWIKPGRLDIDEHSPP